MPFLGVAISWLTAHAGRLAIIGAFSMLLGAGIYMRGRDTAAMKCAAANTEALVEQVEKRVEIHEKVRRMPQSELDRALDEFVRPSN